MGRNWSILVLTFYIYRVLAVILLLSPSLGLFDTLHHGRHASLSVGSLRGERDWYVESTPIFERAFDQLENGTLITFQDAWEPYQIKHISLFLDIPVTAVISILIIMTLFHIFGSTIILKFTSKKQALSELALQGFHALITPHLHVDWEMFYRMSDGKQSIKQSWKR